MPTLRSLTRINWIESIQFIDDIDRLMHVFHISICAFTCSRPSSCNLCFAFYWHLGWDMCQLSYAPVIIWKWSYYLLISVCILITCFNLFSASFLNMLASPCGTAIICYTHELQNGSCVHNRHYANFGADFVRDYYFGRRDLHLGGTIPEIERQFCKKMLHRYPKIWIKMNNFFFFS